MVGSLILCVISVTYIVAIDLCVLCVWSGSFHSLVSRTVFGEYILPTKPKRAITVLSGQC